MLITPDAIADALESAPSWAKMALTVPSPRLREDARLELGRHVYEAICGSDAEGEQLPLPL
jgi:hypothetical protein